MKLIRFGDAGHERPGVLAANGRRLDATAFGEDWNEEFFGSDGLARLDSWLRNHQDDCPIVVDTVRLGPPIARPSKLVCIGLNYSDHARETGATPPAEPVIFFKSTTSICGPFDDLV
ncbi:MAG: fumarylacetoacetate hydrolase family protein, partial [Gemmatimonadota bacterium]|nr:fumarylacetoacetate hydrolase family protein [Gemmatimonadota bacterium]